MADIMQGSGGALAWGGQAGMASTGEASTTMCPAYPVVPKLLTTAMRRAENHSRSSLMRMGCSSKNWLSCGFSRDEKKVACGGIVCSASL